MIASCFIFRMILFYLFILLYDHFAAARSCPQMMPIMEGRQRRRRWDVPLPKFQVDAPGEEVRIEESDRLTIFESRGLTAASTPPQKKIGDCMHHRCDLSNNG